MGGIEEHMNDLISVIVPIYKTELYLRKCVDSLINQTYTNLEIILVDDGSPDGCPQICDEYAAKDSRIKVIHKENGGVSKARNSALDIATGKYFGFIDSDDWAEPKMFEVLYDVLSLSNADISIISYTTNDTVNDDEPPCEVQILSPLEARIEMHKGNKFGGYMTTKLVKRELFEGIRFPENITICEDLALSGSLFERCQTVAYTPYKGYHYIQHETSELHRKVKETDWSVQEACRLLCEQMNSVSPENIKYAYITSIGQDITLAMRLNRAKMLTHVNYRKIRANIKKCYTPEVRKSLSRGIKTRVIAFMLGRPCFTIWNKILRFRLTHFTDRAY